MNLEALIREGSFADQISALMILQETSAGLWLIDSAGTTTWVNQAASELGGRRTEQLVGASAPDSIAAGEPGACAGLGEERWSDRQLIRPDGSTVWVMRAATPLVDERGRRAGTLITLFEIDERKEREVELRMRLEATEALVELAELSLDAPSLRVMLAKSVALVAEQLDVALASISAVDLEQDEVNVLAAAAREEGDWAKELEESGPIRIPNRSLARAAIERAEPVVVQDFERDPAFTPGPQLAAHGIRCAACVPLDNGESVLAALGHEPDAVGRSALPFIESVVTMIARYRTQEQERRHSDCAVSSGGSPTPGASGCRRRTPRPYRQGRRPGPD